MIRFFRISLLCSVFMGIALVPVASESAWLVAVPKAARAALKARSASLDALLRTLRADYDQALSEEASYARQARPLSLASSDADSEDLFDQRRLRWESARDISLGRYGRTSSSGFVSASELEARLDAEGRAFRDSVKPRLERMKGVALDDFIAVAENRIALDPACPVAAFRSLRTAASALAETEKRRWALAVAPARVREVGTEFADMILAYRSAPQDGGPFVAALIRFSDAVAARDQYSDALPSAASAAWFADRERGKVSEFPASAAASLASFLRALAEAEVPITELVLSEYPTVAAAFSETVSLAWVAYRVDPRSFYVAVGLDQGIVKQALERAWSVPFPDNRPGGEEPVSPATVLAVERAAYAAQKAATDEQVLRAFAALKSDAAAARLFRSSARYARERERMTEALSSAVAAAEAACARDTGLTLTRVAASVPFDPFGTMAFAYRSGKAADQAVFPIVLPATYAPSFARTLALSLGWSGTDRAAAASWLEALGFVFTIPYVAAGGRLAPEECALLDSAGAFYPSSARMASARSFLFRDRLSRTAAASGVPFPFVGFESANERTLSALASCAGAYAASPRGKELQKP